VDRRDAAAQIVVVHDIVVDERERLDDFYAHRRRHHIDLFAIDERRERAIVARKRLCRGERLGDE